MKRGNRFIDLTGKRYGKLTVKSYAYMKNKCSNFLCVCDCGNEKIVSSNSLRCGYVTSCSCIKLTLKKFSNTPTHNSWRMMLLRCYNTKIKSYPNYGGRGISVCKRWRDSFFNFLDDMGLRPEGMTIDRIDNNGNYTPENCRWAPLKQQANNKRNNRLIEFNGKTQSITEWSRELGVGEYLIRNRLDKLKWPIERALTTPCRPLKKKKIAA